MASLDTGKAPDPVNAVLRLRIPAGDIEIRKTSDDGNGISGIGFTAVSEDGTYGVRPAGRSILYRAPVKAVKAETVQRCAGSNKPGVRVTFTTVKAGYTYRLYRSEKSGSTWGAYTKVTDMVKSYNGTDQNVWIYDDTAVSGKTYRYYVRCVSKDGAVPLSSYANYVGITY